MKVKKWLWVAGSMTALCLLAFFGLLLGVAMTAASASTMPPSSTELPFPVVPAADGHVCPVPGAAFSNDWGYPRPQNAGLAPTVHEGNDLFAARWTPILSAGAGVVVRVGWNRLGGRTVTVAEASGRQLYYAHMQGYGPAAVVGQVVQPGALLGFVGTTGEGPEGTDTVIQTPHLHLGIYEGGAVAINPYPFTVVWCKRGGGT